MTDTIFFEFSTKRPSAPGVYIWALNNWRTVDIKGNPVHTYSCHSAKWDGEGFKDGGHSIINPDQWAYLPAPDPKEKP